MPRRRRLTRLEPLILERYSTGESLESLALAYAVPISSIRRVLAEAGVPLRSTGQLGAPLDTDGVVRQ